MNLRLVIIADDLTGALDAAAPLAAVPGGVAVATLPDALPDLMTGPLGGAGVISVSTRSRDIGEDEARARVAAVLRTLPSGVRVFKKLDSRLKGNVAAELDPFEGPLLVVPALPEFGRVVRNGMLEGFGVAAAISVAERLGRHAARAVVPDTESPEDVIHALRHAGEATLVGARGLAVALAEDMGLAAPDSIGRLPEPVVFVVGSTDAITVAQVAALRSERTDTLHVPAPSGDVPFLDGVAAPITLIQAVPGPQRAAEDVARRFATGVADRIKDERSLVLTGGATAEAVLDALRVDCLHLLGEALPGLPIVWAGGRVIVTKSGGFGAPGCFVSLLERQGRMEMAGLQ